MKFNILITVFLGLSYLSARAQTNKEALDFLKLNVSEWACEKYAYGTDVQRLSFNLVNNESELELMVKQPEYSSQTGYYRVSIKLREITQIEVVNTGKSCGFIRIQTNPKGLTSTSYDRNKQLTNPYQNVYAFYEKYYWADENIRLRLDDNFAKNAERVVKALKFLALKNGASLNTPSF
jgi:hypothetical protein